MAVRAGLGDQQSLTLWSNLRVANLPDGTPGRRTALASEAATWALFAAFSPLYFGRRSPALGAADTVCSLATTAHAVIVTARLDPPAAWALAPRLAWLALASYVSTVTATRYARRPRGGSDGCRTRLHSPGWSL